jgi:hypothetical protein
MKGKFQTLSAVLLLVLFSSATSTSGQDPKEIINRYLDTISGGDDKKWSLIKTFYAESVEYFNTDEYNSSIPSFGERKFYYRKLYRQWPDKTKEELFSDSAFSHLTSEFLFLSKEHIINIANIPTITSEVNKNLWFEFYPSLVQKWLADAKSVSYEAFTQLPNENIWCHQIDIIDADRTHRLYFNATSNLLEAIFVIEGDYLLRLSGYERHDGYLLHTSERSIKGGNIIGSRTYTKFVFNPVLPASLFKPDK